MDILSYLQNTQSRDDKRATETSTQLRCECAISWEEHFKTSVSGTSRSKTNLTVIVLLVSRDIFMSSQTISVTKEARSKYDQKCSDIFERMGSGVKLSSLGI